MKAPTLFSARIAHDRSLWYELAAQNVERQAIREMPVEVLASLYPHVKTFGPNGELVHELYEELFSARERFFGVKAHEIQTICEDLDGFLVSTELRWRIKPSVNERRSITSNVEMLVERFRFYCSGRNCGDPLCMSTLSYEKRDAFSSLVWEALSIVAYDGFVDFDKLAANPADQELRATLLTIFNSLLAQVSVDGEHYLTAFSPADGKTLQVTV